MRYLYKRSRIARRRQGVRYAARAGLIAAAIMAWSAAAAGTLDMSVRDGLVTMESHAAPLGEVLRKLSEQAGFELVMKQDLLAPVTWRFREVPVEQAVTRLLSQVSSIALYAPAGKGAGQVLSEVRILRGGYNDLPMVEHRTEFAEGRDMYSGPSGVNTAGAVPGLNGTPRIAARNQLASAAATDMQPASRDVGPIDHGLEDGDAAARRDKALRAGKRQPDMARAAMNDALADPDVVVRQRAVQGLARLGGEQSIASLSVVLLQDPDPRVRRLAAAGLGRLNTESAHWALMEANADEDQGVREVVSAALAGLERRGVKNSTAAGTAAQ